MSEMTIDLNRIFENGRGRLRRLQRADLKTKKRYLVIGSVLAMILVVIIWFFYLNLTLPNLKKPAVAALPEEAEENESFFKIIGRGALNLKDSLASEFTSLKNSIGEGVGSLLERFKETREFTIEP